MNGSAGTTTMPRAPEHHHPTRFADYFVICGLDKDSGLEPDKYFGEPFSIPLSSATLPRPSHSSPGFALPSGANLARGGGKTTAIKKGLLSLSPSLPRPAYVFAARAHVFVYIPICTCVCGSERVCPRGKNWQPRGKTRQFVPQLYVRSGVIDFLQNGYICIYRYMHVGTVCFD